MVRSIAGRPEPRDQARGDEEPRERADRARQGRLERGLDPDPAGPPPPDGEHPRIDAPGTEREDARGGDHAERDHEARHEEHRDRSLARRRAVGRRCGRPRSCAPSNSVDEPCPCWKNSRPQHGKIARSRDPDVSWVLESLGEHRSGTGLVERHRRLRPDRCRQARTAPAATRARSRARPTALDRPGSAAVARPQSGHGIDLLAPRPPIAGARLRVQRAVDTVDGHGDHVSCPDGARSGRRAARPTAPRRSRAARRPNRRLPATMST